MALAPRGRAGVAVRSIRRTPTCGHSWSVPQGHRQSVSHHNGKHSLFILPPHVKDYITVSWFKSLVSCAVMFHVVMFPVMKRLPPWECRAVYRDVEQELLATPASSRRRCFYILSCCVMEMVLEKFSQCPCPLRDQRQQVARWGLDRRVWARWITREVRVVGGVQASRDTS